MKVNQLPEVELEYYGAYEREYCSSPVATSPSHESGFDCVTSTVDFDEACFLVQEGAITDVEYIECIMKTDWLKSRVYGEDAELIAEELLAEQIQKNEVNLTWSDLV